MPIEKKYVKLSLAALAVVALVVGLAVGLAPKKRADGGSVTSAAASYGGNVAGDYADECEYGSKSAKGARRRLVVPGTEEYVLGRREGRLRELGTDNALASEGVESNSKSAKATTATANQVKSDKGEAKSGTCPTLLSCNGGKGGSKSSKSDSEKGGSTMNKGSVGSKSGDSKSAGDKSVGNKSVGSKNVGSKNAGGSKSNKTLGAAPAQAPSLCAVATNVTPSPTSGSTPTVSSETTGPPTMPRRDRDGASDGPL